MAPTLQSLEAKMDRILTKLDELTALQNKVIQLEATVDSLSPAVVVLNQ